MPQLQVEDVRLAYDLRGHGPAILIPECNFGWDSRDLDLLTDSYTVITASPRGFGGSGRTTGTYSVVTIRSDLEAVLDHLGIHQYVAFGYSMTGSMVPWLAHDNPRVLAVVSGGFPITTSYSGVLPYIERNLAETRKDPERWEALIAKYDPEALLAWYRHLATMGAGELVDRLQLPIYSYWAGNDEVVDEIAGLETLRAETARRDIPFTTIPQQDHEGLLDRIDLAIPAVRAWLCNVLH